MVILKSKVKQVFGLFFGKQQLHNQRNLLNKKNHLPLPFKRAFQSILRKQIVAIQSLYIFLVINTFDVHK